MVKVDANTYVLGRDISYFVKKKTKQKKKHSDSTNKLSDTNIMFLINNICVIFIFQDSSLTYGYKLCSSSHRLVLLFV